MTVYPNNTHCQMLVGIIKALTHLFCLQGKMIMQDKLEKERNDAKNSVEEYVYDMRDKLHGMYEKFISESVSRLINISDTLCLL